MQDGIADLTEKEKEALRLLLAGHDTKSSAAELGLSVHTINDRLRAARRKLGVTSSREAARILGEAEGSTPKFPAPTQLGMGGSGDEGPVSGQSQPARLSTRTLAWLAGGLAMIALVTAAMLALAPATEPPPQAGAATVSAADARAEEAARAWLALVDAGEWQQSWEQADAMFQSQVTVAQWAEASAQVREPLGALAGREVLTIQQTDNLPGAPAGEYVVMQFAANYANSPDAVETVVMRQGDAGPKVIGYFIR